MTIPPVPPNEEKVKPEIDLTVQARGCKIKPDFFRYSLDEVYGKVHYVRNTVELEDLRARHGDTLVRVDHGVVQFLPGGGFVADMTYLHATPLVSDGDFLKAVPEPLRKGLTALDVQGPTELHTRLYIIDKLPNVNPPRIYWDGLLVLRGVALQTGVKLQHVYGLVAARGWYNGTHLEGVVGNLDLGQVVLYNQPLHNLHGELLVSVEEPDVLKFPGLMMEYCGGQIYGPVRVEFGPKTSFEMNLTASQVQLEELGRHNFKPTTEMSGLAGARLYLTGDSSDIGSLRGSGLLEIPSGKISNLPLLLDLLKFLGLRLPDRTAFEEVHAGFTIEGLRAHVQQLDLYGNAISLRGKGDVNLDGSDLALDFNVDWARLGQLLPPGVRSFPREISNQLLKIEMRGKANSPQFNWQAVPLITDPLRKIMNGGEGEDSRRSPPRPADR